MLSVARFRSSGEIHQWMYDRYSLKALFEKAGFKDAKRVGPTESRIPDWTSYHLDTDPDGAVSGRLPSHGSDQTVKIVHVSTFDTLGGAARSAYRLHQGLRAIGEDSTMFVRLAYDNDPSVIEMRSSRTSSTGCDGGFERSGLRGISKATGPPARLALSHFMIAGRSLGSISCVTCQSATF